MNCRIVADSSVDIKEISSSVPFVTVPLKIITAEREYVDDSELDAFRMAEELRRYKGKSRSSCPNPDEYIAVATTGGLCSFYAEMGGVLVGFEKK